jgi:hypothetical protein
LTKILWKLIFGNNLTFPPPGILSGQKQPWKTESWLLMTQCSASIGRSIRDYILVLLTDCDPEAPCDCEGHHCVEAQSTIGHAAAGSTTSKSVGIPLIDRVPRSRPPPQSIYTIGTG